MEYAQKLISTRAGTMAVAGGAALLAGIFILVYLNRYRHSVKAQGAPVTVLVAKRLIPKGTTGVAAYAGGYFTRTTMRESQLRDGAFSDVASLRTLVATRDVLAGQQLTASDFTAGAKSLASTLAGTQRVIDVPLDAAHGLIGHVQIGDRVDVFVGLNVGLQGGQGYPVIKLLAQGVPVVDVAEKRGGLGASGTGVTNVSLRVNDQQAAALAWATDNGKVWLSLRPPTGARATPPGITNAATILLGVPPVALPSRKISAFLNRKLRQELKALAGAH
jgi:Flp pilus assembly protein CpaB